MDTTISSNGSAILGAAPPQRDPSPAATWPLLAKISAAVILVAAPAAQIIDRALFPMDDGYVSLFHALSTNPELVGFGAVAGMIAPALLIGSVLIWYRLSHARSRIAADIALVSGVLAFSCLAVMTGYSYAALGLHQAGLGTPATAHALEGYAGPPAMALFITFDITSVLCILAAAWALWRSQAVPRGSVILLALFIIMDMALPVPVDVHYVGLVAMVWMAASFFLPTHRDLAHTGL